MKRRLLNLESVDLTLVGAKVIYERPFHAFVADWGDVRRLYDIWPD